MSNLPDLPAATVVTGRQFNAGIKEENKTRKIEEKSVFEQFIYDVEKHVGFVISDLEKVNP